MLTREEKLRFNTWFIYRILNSLIYEEEWENVKAINDQLQTDYFYRGDNNTHFLKTIRIMENDSTIETINRILENHNYNSNYEPITLEEISYSGQIYDSLEYYLEFDIYQLTEYNFCKEK